MECSHCHEEMPRAWAEIRVRRKTAALCSHVCLRHYVMHDLGTLAEQCSIHPKARREGIEVR